MKLVSAKCPNCSANIEVDPTKDAGICNYCQTAFITEKAINPINYNVGHNNITQNFYGIPPVIEKPKKPKKQKKLLTAEQIRFRKKFFLFVIGVGIALLIAGAIVFGILLSSYYNDLSKDLIDSDVKLIVALAVGIPLMSVGLVIILLSIAYKLIKHYLNLSKTNKDL